MKAIDMKFRAITLDGDTIELEISQIGTEYPDDDIFYYNNGVGVPIACHLSSLEAINVIPMPALPVPVNDFVKEVTKELVKEASKEIIKQSRIHPLLSNALLGGLRSLPRSKPFKKGDKVEIIGNVPYPLQNAKRPILGTVTKVDGGYIDVKPKYRRWTAEFYACELRHIDNPTKQTPIT